MCLIWNPPISLQNSSNFFSSCWFWLMKIQLCACIVIIFLFVFCFCFYRLLIYLGQQSPKNRTLRLQTSLYSLSTGADFNLTHIHLCVRPLVISQGLVSNWLWEPVLASKEHFTSSLVASVWDRHCLPSLQKNSVGASPKETCAKSWISLEQLLSFESRRWTTRTSFTMPSQVRFVLVFQHFYRWRWF